MSSTEHKQMIDKIEHGLLIAERCAIFVSEGKEVTYRKAVTFSSITE